MAPYSPGHTPGPQPPRHSTAWKYAVTAWVTAIAVTALIAGGFAAGLAMGRGSHSTPASSPPSSFGPAYGVFGRGAGPELGEAPAWMTPARARTMADSCPVISARLGLHWPYYEYPHTVYPENSLGAIDAAQAAGAGKVEIDTEWSSDGVAMAFHDPAIDRTTAGTGNVSAYTAAQLTAMPLRMEGLGAASTWMSSQHAATDQSLLAEAAADGLATSIEIKPDAITYAQARELLGVIWAAGGAGNTVEETGDIRSYIPAVLAEMRTAGYWGHLTLTSGPYTALAAGAPYWQESIEYDAAGLPVTADQVAALAAAGVRADIYTPDTAAALATVPAGAGQVTTDNVHAAAAWEAAGC
jgi:glycerophosphoryl diester phosphodiesterase